MGTHPTCPRHFIPLQYGGIWGSCTCDLFWASSEILDYELTIKLQIKQPEENVLVDWLKIVFQANNLIVLV